MITKTFFPVAVSEENFFHVPAIVNAFLVLDRSAQPPGNLIQRTSGTAQFLAQLLYRSFQADHNDSLLL